MENAIHYKILNYEMEKDRYHIKGDFDDSFSALFQYEKNLVHRINRFYFTKLAELQFSKEIEYNFGFIIHESQLLLFNMGAAEGNGKYYTCINGWVFDAKDIHFVWLNLREIIMVMKTKKDTLDRCILEEDLYSFRNKKSEDVIPKEMNEFLRGDFIPKSFVCTNLAEEIWTQIPYVFRISSVIEPKSNTVIKREEWNADLTEYIREYNDRFERYGNVNLEYEIPDIRKRPRQEGYFKERKKIKTDIKNRSANWRLHTIVHHKHYVRWIEIPMDNVRFDGITKFFAGMRERIDRGD